MRKWLILICLLLITSSVFAKGLALKTPTSVVTNENKIAYSYRAQEKLRLLHNIKGKDFREGRLTKEQWESWKTSYFEPRNAAISLQIIEAKKTLKTATIYTVDMEKDFEEKTVINIIE